MQNCYEVWIFYLLFFFFLPRVYLLTNINFQHLHPSHMKLHTPTPGTFLIQTTVFYHHGQTLYSCQTAIIIEIHLPKPALMVISSPPRNMKCVTKTKNYLIYSGINIWQITLIVSQIIEELEAYPLNLIALRLTVSELQILTKTKGFQHVLCQDKREKTRNSGKHRSGGLMGVCLSLSCQMYLP